MLTYFNPYYWDDKVSQVFNYTGVEKALLDATTVVLKMSKGFIPFKRNLQPTDLDLLGYGLLEVAAKVQFRPTMTCFNNGKQFVFAAIAMFQKFVLDTYNQDAMLDANDALVKTMQMCNYIDTLAGIVFLNILIAFIRLINRSERPTETSGLAAVSFILRLVEMSTFLMDFLDLTVIVQGLAAHGDFYNLGQLIGKGVKMAVMLAFEISSFI